MNMQLLVFRLNSFCLSKNMIHKIRKTNDFGRYYNCKTCLTKKFAKITFQKFGTDVMWEQALCRYCEDPLASSDADRGTTRKLHIVVIITSIDLSQGILAIDMTLTALHLFSVD